MTLILFLFINLQFVFADSPEIGRMYFTEIMGHVHKNPTQYSSSLTGLQCGHKVKVFSEKESSVPKGWLLVQVGEDKGYIEEKFLSPKSVECLQSLYPKFFTALNLDLSDLYYWGRLYDQYTTVRSRSR